MKSSLEVRRSLQVENLEVRRGMKRLLSGLSLRVEPGQVLVIRGVNGSGKTSLLRVLAGLSEAARGSVSWSEEETSDSSRYISYVAHHPALHPAFTADENLQLGLSLQGREVAHAERLALFKQLALPMHLPAARLSQGQQRRLVYAQLILAQRPVWLLDEPLTALDDAAIVWFRQILAQHLEQGGLCVMSLHQHFDWPSAQLQTLQLDQFQPVRSSVMSNVLSAA